MVEWSVSVKNDHIVRQCPSMSMLCNPDPLLYTLKGTGLANLVTNQARQAIEMHAATSLILLVFLSDVL